MLGVSEFGDNVTDLDSADPVCDGHSSLHARNAPSHIADVMVIARLVKTHGGIDRDGNKPIRVFHRGPVWWHVAMSGSEWSPAFARECDRGICGPVPVGNQTRTYR